MAEAAYGSIHAVVNNAGVTARQPALDQDERAWDRLLAQWIDEPVGTGQP
jgi:NAD(P)-dependent dehydrogenase (short-subunit alcohol dehydrogenase family)